MKPDRWQQIENLLQSALALAPEERSSFLAGECRDDESLRQEVESLVASHEQAENFLETPLSQIAAEWLVRDHVTLEERAMLGSYRIASILGKGGMGEVYLAEDLRLGRNVALKVLPPHFTRDKQRLYRFEQEARSASLLNHPNILTIYEIGEVDGLRFIATEFIDGVTLRHRMKSTQLSIGESLDISVQVASALTAAHAAGIVHRDIKPENIMVRTDGYAKVLDFGLAKLTEQNAMMRDREASATARIQTSAGMVMGTLSYMSPEQARGLSVDTRTDIWSLGVVLYELVTGRVPFAGETPSHEIVSILETEPSPLSRHAEVPAELERIVTKALCKNKDERYQTARDLGRDLKSLRHELELEGRLEHSIQRRDPGENKITARTEAIDTDKELSTPTGTWNTSRVGGRISYLYRNITAQRRSVVIALATIIIAAGVLALGLYKFSGRNPAANKKNGFQVDMVAVPGGTFEMGRDDGKPEEVPAHTVTVNSFYIDRTKVTNAEYEVFVRETEYRLPIHWSGNFPPADQEKWPVTNVSKDDADAFAVWRSRRDGIVYRLPTEQEWEYAARNGGLNTLYPWGFGTPPDTQCGQRNEPVKSHPTRVSYRGIYDLVGDVHEWTSSKLSHNPGSRIEIKPEFRDWIIYKGGCFRGDEPPGVGVPHENGITSASRDYLPASRESPVIGFRLVRSSY